MTVSGEVRTPTDFDLQPLRTTPGANSVDSIHGLAESRRFEVPAIASLRLVLNEI